MNSSKIKWITRTALLIALIFVAQILGNYMPGSQILIGPIRLSQLITGSLVNLTLIIAAGVTGLGSGITAGIVSSLLASIIGTALPLPQMIPVVALGNAVIVAVAWLIFQKGNGKSGTVVRILGVLAGAAAKTAVLWASVSLIIVPLFQPAEKVVALITLNFSWPQMITATIGGLIAIAILPVLKKAIK